MGKACHASRPNHKLNCLLHRDESLGQDHLPEWTQVTMEGFCLGSGNLARDQ